MVDNEQPDARRADDVKQIPLICRSSSGFACTTQTAQLIVTDNNEDDMSASALSDDTSDRLRHIVIDGSNIAMSHGNRTAFSCRGIKLAVDWFRQRGHRNITVFVPQWRRETHRQECTVIDPEIMFELELEKILVFTPSRKIGGKRVVCYDDRYIVKLAAETDGVIVSNDTFRDLADENPNYRKAIDERLLMYSFVSDRFMPPDDPLGRHGPSLDDFLSKQPPAVSQPSRPPSCPYAKCTFGAKCRYYHPERTTSTCHRPNPSLGTGDKLSGSAVDSSGNSVISTTPCHKKKFARSQRSYEKQKPDNEHLHLKPFRSDPTNSAYCGHLALARELSNEYKPKSRHIPESSKGHVSVKHSEDLPNTQSGDNGSENLHQRLRRQLAIPGSSDPRAANLHVGRTHGANYVVEPDADLHVYPDCASDGQSVNLLGSLSDVSSSCNTRNSCVDTIQDAGSSSCTNRVNPTKSELTFCHDPQLFVAAGSSSQDHVSGGRLASPFLPPTSTCVSPRPLVRPLVPPYVYGPDLRLHSCRQFRTPQMVPRIHLSPNWPQGFVHQPRPYLPRNEQMRHSAITQHHFLHR